VRYLLVEPAFPVPNKSRNHHNFLPIGLLKLGAYLENAGHQVKLIRGVPELFEARNIIAYSPDEVWITSLFTYWVEHVRRTVTYYRELLPGAPITVGGILASLMDSSAVRKLTGCDNVHQGVVEEAEGVQPAYHLLGNDSVDYHILHSSRGCSRRCQFCGTWRIEPEFTYKRTLGDISAYRRLVFYDNNFLANPCVEDILAELIEARSKRQLFWCESQSGFDGRILIRKNHLAGMLRKAGFRYPRIAWDGKYKEQEEIRDQLSLLQEAGYDIGRDIYVFMLYNWNIGFEELESKRVQCWNWGVQIADCRFRPLDQLYDHFSARLPQSAEDYYIHGSGGWTDNLVKQFRRNIREQNICIRHGLAYYSRALERTRRSSDPGTRPRRMDPQTARSQGLDVWLPNDRRPE